MPRTYEDFTAFRLRITKESYEAKLEFARYVDDLRRRFPPVSQLTMTITLGKFVDCSANIAITVSSDGTVTQSSFGA